MSQPNESTVNLILYLSYIRSLGIVSQALVKSFPDEESWNAARCSDEFIDDLNQFSELLVDMKTRAFTAENEEAANQLIVNNYDLVLESVQAFSEKHKIPIEDLVYILMHG